jgi:hypothetical protein
MKISIKPITKTLDTFEITGVNVKLDQSAWIQVVIYNEEGMGISYTLEMTPEEYAAWGTNDDYVINWALAKVGAQRA